MGPTRKDTINRHWQQPLVEGVQEITDTEFLKLKPNCDYTERTNLVAAVLYTLLPSPIRRGRRLLAGRTNPLQGGFFRLQGKRLRAEKKDLKKILSECIKLLERK
ncbi:hypothetical protein ABI57_24870 [Salmonella enterica subsp. enterica serovar Veneziana]|nr:hypothetical protein ABI57_24870 [Salmonella enterica subsp. enterica serovar Veneziana]